MVGERIAYPGEKVPMVEVLRRDVERKRQVPDPRGFPAEQVAADGVQHPVAERNHQPVLFGERQELARADQPALIRRQPAYRRQAIQDLSGSQKTELATTQCHADR